MINCYSVRGRGSNCYGVATRTQIWCRFRAREDNRDALTCVSALVITPSPHKYSVDLEQLTHEPVPVMISTPEAGVFAFIFGCSGEISWRACRTSGRGGRLGPADRRRSMRRGLVMAAKKPPAGRCLACSRMRSSSPRIAISSRLRICSPTMRTNDTGSVSFSRTSTRTSCSRSSAASIAPVGPHPAMITSNMTGARSAPEAGDQSPGTSPTVESRSTVSVDDGSAVNCRECIGVAFRECLVGQALPATPTSIARP